MGRFNFVSNLKRNLFGARLGAGGGEAVAIQLSWTDNASDETGYTIERSTNGVSYSVIDTIAADSESYEDNVPAGATYYYRVRANNANGGSYSNVDSVEV